MKQKGIICPAGRDWCLIDRQLSKEEKLSIVENSDSLKMEEVWLIAIVLILR
jgi:hypothetical protein